MHVKGCHQDCCSAWKTSMSLKCLQDAKGMASCKTNLPKIDQEDAKAAETPL